MEENDIPQEVMDQVNQIRQDEGLGNTQDVVAEDAPTERHKLTRRQKKEQEENEQKAAREARENELLEAARSAAEEAKELRKQRNEDAERMARMEGMLQAGIIHQRQTVQAPQAPDEESAERVYQRKIAEANTAVAAGKMDEFHAKVREANEALWADREKKILGRIPQPQQQQQQWVKPDWITAVESQYPDVVMYRDEKTTGQASVAFMHQFMYGPNTQPTPETLNKAFARVRTELGTDKDKKEEREAVDKKRQMLAGGRPTGNRGGGASTGGKGVGKGDQYVKGVPANWREIARANRMTEAQFLSNFAEMNPGNVERG